MAVNLDGMIPVRTVRMGGICEWDDALIIPPGLAIFCYNMAFVAESVKQRWGLRFAMRYLGGFGDPTGVDVLTVLGAQQAPTVNQQTGGAQVSTKSLNPNAIVGNEAGFFQPIPPSEQVGLVFTDTGSLYLELPAGSGNLVPVTDIAASLATLMPTNAGMVTSKAYNRIYQAYANFVGLPIPSSAGPVLALDAATGFESTVGQNPIAAPWKPLTFYQQGDIVTPTAGGSWFRRLADGYSGATEPVWPATLGYFIPFYQANYAEAGDAGALGARTTTVAPITILGTAVGVGVVSTAGFVAGNVVQIDTGANAENVTITHVNPGVRGGTPTLSAIFTKPHASGVTIVQVQTILWQEWTPGFPTYLPTPPPITSLTQSAGGVIPAGKDVYIYISYFNDLGESIWAGPFIFSNTTANVKLTGTFTANPASGPPMPTWLMTEMNKGTVGGFHWPATKCVNVYVGSAFHGAAAPTQIYLWTRQSADQPIVITSLPSPGIIFTPVTTPTAAISAKQFMGEGGLRNAILLRQDTMGDLSGVDPAGVLSISFVGAVNAPGLGYAFSSTSLLIAVDDFTPFAIGQQANVALPSLNISGAFTLAGILVGQTFQVGSAAFIAQAEPSGILEFTAVGLTPGTSPSPANVATVAGPCPVAVLPPGSQEGPGYSYDVVALAVVGLGESGPFNYLTDPNPSTAFSTTVLAQGGDGFGNGYANLASTQGLQPGDTVVIAGWPTVAPYVGLGGQTVLASVNTATNVVIFPSTFNGAGGAVESLSGITMTVVQTQPTQAVAASGPFILQFDDTTLPQGVNVTGNLLFVALPPCTDLAYIPSIDRMAYVSDKFPTTIIFSEEEFMGEVDGLNDALAVEPSNGALLVGVRELLNGTIVACKQNGGYQIVPTADVPARWGINRLWGEHGPVSGKNIAKGRDGTCLDFMLFVDPESGLYKWPPTLGMGELDWLSKELSGANNQDASRMATWDRVNRSAGATIEVIVDTIAKEVKIAVPLDGAASPSHILTMSYFNGWQDPLTPNLQGEWVANRQSRRWNIDPIPTNCMALVRRTLATPVDQRVNYQQLLLGVPSFLASTYATLQDLEIVVPIKPSITPGTYYAQLAKVTGGVETAYSPVLGPFIVNYGSASQGWLLETVIAQLPGDGLEDSWTLYFGTSPTNLTESIAGIPNNITSYTLQTNGSAALTPVGFAGIQYMQPGAYDDLGGGYLARYRPSYARQAQSQEFPDGGMVMRWIAVTGLALGAGNMLIEMFSDDPEFNNSPKVQSLDQGEAEIPGSAPITRFNRGERGDGEFMTCEFSNGGIPGNWFQLLQYTLWHAAQPLLPSR